MKKSVKDKNLLEKKIVKKFKIWQTCWTLKTAFSRDKSTNFDIYEVSSVKQQHIWHFEVQTVKFVKHQKLYVLSRIMYNFGIKLSSLKNVKTNQNSTKFNNDPFKCQKSKLKKCNARNYKFW